MSAEMSLTCDHDEPPSSVTSVAPGSALDPKPKPTVWLTQLMAFTGASGGQTECQVVRPRSSADKITPPPVANKRSPTNDTETSRLGNVPTTSNVAPPS